MSDDAIDPAARINEFIRRKKIDFRCVVCGARSWGVLEGNVGLPASMSPARFGLEGHAVYALGCTNCGYVQAHLRSVVDAATDSAASPDVETKGP